MSSQSFRQISRQANRPVQSTHTSASAASAASASAADDISDEFVAALRPDLAEPVDTTNLSSAHADLGEQLSNGDTEEPKTILEELELYLMAHETEKFKFVCFFPNHSLLYSDIKKNINLLSKEEATNDHTLLKYILNIQFKLLKVGNKDFELGIDQYPFINMVSILCFLLQIDVENIPFDLIKQLIQHKLYPNFIKHNHIIFSFINRHLENFFYNSAEVKRIKEECSQKIDRELEDNNLMDLKKDNIFDKITPNLLWRGYDRQSLDRIKKFNSIINKHIELIAKDVIQHYRKDYKDIFFENLIKLSDSDKEFINNKVEDYIRTKFSDVGNSTESPFDINFSENYFYISEEEINTRFYTRLPLYPRVMTFIGDILTNDSIKDIFDINHNLMIGEISDPKFSSINQLVDGSAMIKKSDLPSIDPKLLKEYNEIIVKYQNIVLECIHEYTYREGNPFHKIFNKIKFNKYLNMEGSLLFYSH